MMEDSNGVTKCPKKAYISRNHDDSDQGPGHAEGSGGYQSMAEMAREARMERHVRVDSLSTLSLPDDLRISFSEIEDGSLQLDDIDLTCSSSMDVDLTSRNITAIVDMKEEKEVQGLSVAISSTSRPHYQQMENVKVDQSVTVSAEGSNKEETSSDQLFGVEDVVVKSESNKLSDLMFDSMDSWKVGGHAQQVSTVGSSGQGLKRKAVSARRTSKNKHLGNMTCQVCGDVAAGFYCGAYICEACKKFYMRAYKQDKLKYVCLRDKKCVITKESRVQCQYCRFQKCIELNMYCPKQGENEVSKDMQMSEIPCRVCSAPSSGFHFGAITCEGCKGFFRRMAKEREAEKYQCNKKGECEINMITRNLCKACRYKACVRAGMSVEGSRIGRQPNSVKHAISLELKNNGKDGFENLFPLDAGLSKVKDEPIECTDDFLRDKSNDTSQWESWANSNYSLPASSAQNSLSDSQYLPTVNNTLFSDASTRTNERTSSISSDHSVVSPVLGPPSSQASWGFSPTAPANQQPATQGQLFSPTNQQAAGSNQPFSPKGQKPSPMRSERTQQASCSPDKHSSASLSAGSSNSNLNAHSDQASASVHSERTRKSDSGRMSVSSGSGHSFSPISTPGTPCSPLSKNEYCVLSNIPMASPKPKQPEVVDEKLSAVKSELGKMKTMEEFIGKLVEAGKCLQLLNYRVFDTDVNPATSMNVDDIKTLFKSNYMDPREGNRIISKVDKSIFSTRESTWNYMMTNFHHNTYITIRFAKLVPGFKTLSLNDQVVLIQSSIYPIELLNMSKVYDPTTKKYNYFTYTKEEEDIMMEQFPMLRVFQEHFLHVGEMVTTFGFTDVEFSILSALLLFPSEIHGLENPRAVEYLQNEISEALQYYEEKTFPDGLTRYGILLVRVAELVQCLLQHNLAIGLLLTHNPTIKVPQLFHELIIESIKEGQK